MSEVERIAREAVALCADLLRRYHMTDTSGLMLSAPAVGRHRYDEWGERVLAWQDQLDQAPAPIDFATEVVQAGSNPDGGANSEHP